MKRTILSCCLLLLICCKPSENLTEISFELPAGTAKISNFDYKIIGNDEYFTFVNPEKKHIGLFSLQQQKISAAISFSALDSIHDMNQGVSYFIHNLDSIFILPKGGAGIYLINSKGAITKKWIIYTTLSNNNSNFVLENLPQMPLFYQDKRIYVQVTRMDIMVNNAEGRNTYFNSPPELIIDLSTYPETIINSTGKWPLKYLEKGLDYDDYWPSRCINKNGEIIYSFSITPEIEIYKSDTLYKKVKAESPYVKTIHSFPDTMVGNVGFKKKYWITESRYGKIIYDQYRNVYYRIVIQGIPYEKQDGNSVNTMEDKPWAIQIFDSSMNFKKEIQFDPDKYSPYYIFPLKEGVWVLQREKTKQPNNFKKFSRINLAS